MLEKKLLSLPLILSTLFFTSCSTYKIPTENYANTPIQLNCAKNNLYKIVPRKKEQLEIYDLRYITWALFGNEEDGIFAENYKEHTNNPLPQSPIKWWIRNPLHNLSWHVLGDVSDKEREDYTLIKLTNENISFLEKKEGETLPKENFGLYFAFHNYKPFISLKISLSSNREFQSYIGWRNKGNLGIKLRPFAKKSK
jgi:hypothetical protein